MSLDKYPNLEGGACTDLAPGVADKYFDSNASKDPFLAKTAKAICARCVIQPQCLEAALQRTYPDRGVVGGMTASAIRRAKEWDAWDKGLRTNPPQGSRPDVPNFYQQAPAVEDAEAYRERTALSFEEQVYGIFLDVKQGKYKTLNQAIGDIALIHSQVIEDMQS
ncbi:hypothetical protein QFZ60_001546 [Arthrobacter sp. B2I5]|uniref:WhiB family transcriptional regulator n=1 Tax=Arthrobacter sp. B2I5 TaxID=3042266 RepID=UPI00277E02B2|nr:WhiB family transcriptional regulator [Arthrobacter sp. B2I5]MDQ0825373.1 hypothetical protein [Arthrobacter sp. B2I5]